MSLIQMRKYGDVNAKNIVRYVSTYFEAELLLTIEAVSIDKDQGSLT